MATAGISEIRTPQLFIQPSLRRFGLNDEQVLVDYLSQPANNCVLRMIARPEDLLLDANGQTVDGHRYTWTGLKAVTAVACDGLHTAMLDLVGYRRTRERREDLCDFSTAVAYFNAAVRLRFNRFSSLQVVCTPGSRTIDGVVSEAYQFVGNGRYVEMLTTAVTRESPAKFLAALISGRKLWIWFREASPSFGYNHGRHNHPHWLGFFGTNSEGTHTSMRVAPAVYSQLGAAVAGNDQHGRRQVHVGQDMEVRLAAMFRQVVHTAPKPENYLEHAYRWDVNLNVPSDEQNRLQRITAISGALNRIGLPRAVATEIVMLGLCQGGDLTPDLQVHQDSGYRFPERTVYDLVCGAMRCGVRVGIQRRESVEQAAYALLTGNITLPGATHAPH